MSLLVVGSVAFDSIETPHNRVDLTLGGAASYFALRPVISPPYGWWEWWEKISTTSMNLFFTAGRSIWPVWSVRPGKTFFWAGRYSLNMNERTTLATELNVFAGSSRSLPQDLLRFTIHFSREYRSYSTAFRAEQVQCKPKLVALDTMNYWIERTPAELGETLKHVQILMINDDETRQLTGEHNLLRAAKKYLPWARKLLLSSAANTER